MKSIIFVYHAEKLEHNRGPGVLLNLLFETSARLDSSVTHSRKNRLTFFAFDGTQCRRHRYRGNSTYFDKLSCSLKRPRPGLGVSTAAPCRNHACVFTAIFRGARVCEKTSVPIIFQGIIRGTRFEPIKLGGVGSETSSETVDFHFVCYGIIQSNTCVLSVEICKSTRLSVLNVKSRHYAILVGWRETVER